MKVKSEARSNIALVKYWGKRDPLLNLPAAGSVSMTLSGLTTQTELEFADVPHDLIVLNGTTLEGKGATKLSTFVDRIRDASGEYRRVRMTSNNNFPTAAGLASSASGFAALTVAAAAAAGLELSPRELSVLARQGSGSASRSIPGGFVHWHRGELADGTDSFAESVAPPDYWDLACLVLVTVRGEKDIPSTAGMNQTMATSPYYQAWVDSVAGDITEALAAIATKDFEKLADVAERSCLAMHASALAAKPGVLYWNAKTVDLIHSVRSLRSQGIPCFFTIDAGPHVKVFCEAAHADRLKLVFEQDPNVIQIIMASPGAGARVVPS